MPEPVKILAREGPTAYRAKCEPPILRDYTTYQANDEWHADHTLCNFWIRGENGEAARPWKTEWMDLRSRRSVGAILYLGHPTTEAVLTAFARAAGRHGVPRVVRMDNGREFSAKSFAGRSRRWRLSLDEARILGALALLQVEAHFTIPENPRSKGALERKFRTDEEWFDRSFPTYCGNSPKTRPEDVEDRLQEPGVLLQVREADRLYQQYVERVYNERPHEGQGMDGVCPREAYEATLGVKRVVAQAELRFCLWKATHTLTVERRGVRLFDHWYRFDGLGLRLGQKVFARYDPGSLGKVWLFDLQDSDIGAAECQELLAKGATEADWRRVKRTKRYEAGLVRSLTAVRAARQDAPHPWDDVKDRPRPPGGEPKVVEPVRTPMRAVAKVALAACGGGAPVPAPRSWLESLLDTAASDPFAREED
jgi:hypothetical protein